MEITLTPGMIITAASFIGAAVILVRYFAGLVRWTDQQKKQDQEIQGIQEELTLVIYAVQACLKGLHSIGCDGPVDDAIDKIEKHLNVKAHKA